MEKLASLITIYEPTEKVLYVLAGYLKRLGEPKLDEEKAIESYIWQIGGGEKMKAQIQKISRVKGMVSHEESMRKLKRVTPEAYKALKNPEPQACLAWNVLENRHNKGYSQKILAEKAGVSLRTIAYIEDYDEKFRTNIKVVQGMAKALGVKFTDLFQTIDMTKEQS
jgi:DNA-binding XRE family transcriptional regulator